MKKLFLLLPILHFATCFAQNIWEPVNFPDTLYSTTINAQKEGLLFVATGDGYSNYKGLFRSADQGVSWEELEDCAGKYIYCVNYNAAGDLYVGAGSGVLKSTDDGDTFELVYHGGNNILSINFSPEGEIYAVGWADILRSSDDGATWDTLLDCPSTQYLSDIDFGLNGEIYVVGGAYYVPGGGFTRSLDHGVTWENIGITHYLNYMEVNDAGSIIVAGDMGRINKSDDRGETWTDLSNCCVKALESNSFDDLFSVFFDYSTYTLSCKYSADWGSTWIDLTEEILSPNIQQISIAPDNRVFLLCAHSSDSSHQIFRSVDPIVRTNNQVSRDEISIFPIPAKEKIFISTTLQLGGYFSIYNQLGEVILKGSPDQYSIDVSMLKPGLYILELEKNGEKFRRKVLKG